MMSAGSPDDVGLAVNDLPVAFASFDSLVPGARLCSNSCKQGCLSQGIDFNSPPPGGGGHFSNRLEYNGQWADIKSIFPQHNQ